MILFLPGGNHLRANSFILGKHQLDIWLPHETPHLVLTAIVTTAVFVIVAAGGGLHDVVTPSTCVQVIAVQAYRSKTH